LITASFAQAFSDHNPPFPLFPVRLGRMEATRSRAALEKQDSQNVHFI